MRAASEVSAARERADGAPRRRYFHRCSCGRPIPEGVMRCSSRTCPEYAPTWARDTRRRLLENLRIVPLTVMFSLTAPGADLYPFDPRFCSHLPRQRCSGALGCRVDPAAAEAFKQAGGRVVEPAASRGEGSGRPSNRAQEGSCSRGSGRSRSAGSPTSTASSLQVHKSSERGLRRTSRRYGRWPRGTASASSTAGTRSAPKFWPGEQAGAYLSSYFVRGRGRRLRSPKRFSPGDMPRVVVFVGRSLTQIPGCTMLSLRHARRLWASRELAGTPPAVTLEEWLAAAKVLSQSERWRRAARIY